MTRFRSVPLALAALLAAALPNVTNTQTCGTTVPPGIVTPGLTWGIAGSPYCVTGDIQVSLLKINPGVTVIVQGPFKIEVLTTIQVNGTAENPVTFTKGSGGPWKGIDFVNTGPGSHFKHTIIEGSNESGVAISGAACPTFTSCQFLGNANVGSGGGLNTFDALSDLVVTDCLFSGNTASLNGAGLRVRLADGFQVICVDTVFAGNTANPAFATGDRVGGGIWLETGDATIEGCTFENNMSYSRCSSSFGCNVSARGGAVHITSAGSTSIGNSVFAGNGVNASNGGNCAFGGSTKSFGAGVYVGAGTVTIDTCVFSCGSTAGTNCGYSDGGGGVAINSGTLTMNHCTIARNSSATGVHLLGGTLDVTNSIVHFNNASGTQIGGAATVTYSNVEGGYTGMGNNGFSPAFAGTGCSCGDLSIVLGSPAIDAADPLSGDDAARPPGMGMAAPDMGANGGPLNGNWASGLESVPPSPALVSVSTGTLQPIDLDLDLGPDHAGDVYLMLGSVSGFAPGFQLDGFCIPLNLDAYFTVTVNDPGATLANSFGVLDAQGQAQANFSLPGNLSPNLVGFFLYHSTLVVRVTLNNAQLVHVTNPVAVELGP